MGSIETAFPATFMEVDVWRERLSEYRISGKDKKRSIFHMEIPAFASADRTTLEMQALRSRLRVGKPATITARVLGG